MAKQVQPHHGDVAALVQLQIHNFERGRSFAWSRPGGRQLHKDLLGIRIQHNRRYLKRRRKVDRGNLKWNRNGNGSLPLL